MNAINKRNLAKGLGPVLLLSAALALPAAATAQPSRYGYGGPYSGRGARSVDGFVTFRGGSCPAIRDHRSGQSYFLTGNTRELRPGDHVVLGGRLASGSACGVRGPALQVLEIRTVWTGGDHRAAYFDARRDGSFERFILRSRDRGGWYADRYSYFRQGRGPRGGRGYDAPYDRARPNGVPYDDDRGQYQGQPQGQPDDRGQYDRRPQPDDSYDDEEITAPNDDDYAAPNGTYDRDDDRQDDRADRSGGNRQLITVDGTFEFDSTCPSLRGTDGKSYDLAGELGNSHDGDRVRVRGFLAGRSSCGGTALEVQEIRRR
jgi:hypothetical protein